MKKLFILVTTSIISISINSGLGYILFIPIVLYYLKKSVMNYLYIIIPSIVLTLIVCQKYIIILLATLMLCLLFNYIINKMNKSLIVKYTYYLLYIIVVNFLVLLYCNKTISVTSIIYILISLILFTILDISYISKNKIVIPMIMIDTIVLVLSIISLNNIELSFITYTKELYLSYIPISISTIYFSREYKNIYTIISTVFIFIFTMLYNEEVYIMIFLLALLYSNKSKYMFLLLNGLLGLMLIYPIPNNIYKDSYLILIYTIIASLLSEAIMLFSKYEDNKEYMISDIALISNKMIEKEYNSFSMFLQYFSDTFKYNSSYQKQLSKACSVIIDTHCNRCNKKTSCHNDYKLSLATDFISIIEDKELPKEFKKHCDSSNGILQTSLMLSHQMSNNINKSDYVLQAILDNCNKILDKLSTTIKDKEIIKPNILLKIYNSLIKLDYVQKIEFEKIYVDDFIFDVILKKETQSNSSYDDNIYMLLSYIEQVIPFKTHINITKNSNTIRVTKNEVIHIKYGYGSLSSKSNEICGDNYLIKSFSNQHLLFAISDGMGKGLLAYNDSKRILEALELLTYSSLSIYSCVEILNLLYILQGYTERYSTIDCIDVDRTNKCATFYKLGASTTYIIHDDNAVTKVENSSLPLGIEEDITYKQLTLQDNDLVIMTSDGIFENIDEESDLLYKIKSIKDKTPEEISYNILDYTLNAKVKVKDDMSVIVFKVEDI